MVYLVKVDTRVKGIIISNTSRGNRRVSEIRFPK